MKRTLTGIEHDNIIDAVNNGDAYSAIPIVEQILKARAVPVNEDRIKEIKDKGDKTGGYMKKIDWNSPYGGALAGVIALVVIFLFFIGFMWLYGTYPIVGLVLFGILVLLFVGIWLFEKWFELKRLQSEYLRNQSLRGKKDE